MTGRVTVSRELLRQVLRLFDKALDKDNVFGKLHNDAMDCMNDIQVALAQPAPPATRQCADADGVVAFSGGTEP